MAATAVNLASWSRLALVALVGLVLQVAVFDQIVVHGAHPDVLVLLAAAAGAVAGSARGATIGFVVGLVADLVLPTPYGLSALAFVLVGFAAGLVRTLPGDRDGRGVQVATCVAGGTAGTLLYAVLGDLLGQPGMLDRQGAVVVLVVTAGAFVLAAPCVGSLRWVMGAADRTLEGHPMPSGGSATR
ncbi:MAG TPA: rod shape-determining protein MreD [Acidimicrobiales bacterium]|nr:rod shape-determining protein MreD [Acidimicrobiales bacterium]